MKEGRKPEYPEKTPDDEFKKMPRTKAERFKCQARLEPVQQHWWQVRKADVLTVTPRYLTKSQDYQHQAPGRVVARRHILSYWNDSTGKSRVRSPRLQTASLA